jgi:hypothetical protein
MTKEKNIMADIAGFPYFEIQFDKQGSIFKLDELETLIQFLSSNSITDLFVMAHGWNNNMAEARALYQQFFGSVREVLNAGQAPELASRTFAVLGLFWPSKKFADQDLIAGGAAGWGSSISNTSLEEQLDILQALVEDKDAEARLEQAKKLIPDLENKATARQEFVTLVRSMLSPPSQVDVDASEEFFQISGEELLQRLKKPVLPVGTAPSGKGGGTAVSPKEHHETGGGVGFQSMFGNIKMGVRNLLNLATYYQMKERAGQIGQHGLNQVVRQIRKQSPAIKLHLIGHSFGGRLVSAAAAGGEGPEAVPLSTLTLLQAAFSHYGFAQQYDGAKDGFFRKAVSEQRISGPILITHTDNDKAVGLAYPLASMVAKQVGARLGDRHDKYGGIGRNGALITPEAVAGNLQAVGQPYPFQGGKLYNLQADDYIKDHSDVCHPEIAYALLSAVAST